MNERNYKYERVKNEVKAEGMSARKREKMNITHTVKKELKHLKKFKIGTRK